VRRFASAAEADRHDLEFWRQMPDVERMLHAWRLNLAQLPSAPPMNPDFIDLLRAFNAADVSISHVGA
jgi:hypothetical protein